MNESRREEATRKAAEGSLPQTVEEGTLALEAVSVFKSGAETLIADLLKKHGDNRVQAFSDFMWAELRGRANASPDTGEKRAWEDAGNVFQGPLFILDESSLAKRKDVEMLMADLRASKEGKATKTDVGKMQVYIDVYMAARRRIFPEFRFR